MRSLNLRPMRSLSPRMTRSLSPRMTRSLIRSRSNVNENKGAAYRADDDLERRKEVDYVKFTVYLLMAHFVIH